MVKKKKEKKLIAVAKKKMAVARANIRKGKGIIRVNSKLIDLIEDRIKSSMVREPLMLAGPLANEVDIDVSVHGGGSMGQTVAVRGAIAKALVDYAKDEKLRKAFLEYDRWLLVDDPRRVESKKPLGTKARAKKQLSRR
jgi:small subunit ribosomal protein S9